MNNNKQRKLHEFTEDESIGFLSNFEVFKNLAYVLNHGLYNDYSPFKITYNVKNKSIVNPKKKPGDIDVLMSLGNFTFGVQVKKFKVRSTSIKSDKFKEQKLEDLALELVEQSNAMIDIGFNYNIAFFIINYDGSIKNQESGYLGEMSIESESIIIDLIKKHTQQLNKNCTLAFNTITRNTSKEIDSTGSVSGARIIHHGKGLTGNLDTTNNVLTYLKSVK